ncbi:bifunctional helix-turn-helix domain-containing protein/methylated-DNA--[protein]-cysteine S-methyltransferase [Allomuricauda sp. F6463D]|uniref:bifunctional helix-turn-helix domain-containing protein/methylated-DNA--[protein]-cysteine S-methyltransferase n=1 Tax=Allomuricauda sp. F6463D TaxID=2926409 RepID=UPI001FF5DAA8|nr:methylated-DNA--[protein]-cysteine S-methyltransferase [Muricauda sp. F6463D]MCK0159023.1 methylated-DNA--[protein]-cysteine S-methyltransferase [Muricauda sp. F6463D]
MNDQKHQNYYRIAKAIEFIKDNFKEQPTLEELSKKVNLSQYHFQRIFTEWAGTSPKKFLQYVSLQYAKIKLAKENTLFDTAFETGLSGTSRLHDLFVKVEGMSPAEYKNGGKNLKINYSYSSSHFGKLIIASTNKGICYLSFFDEEKEDAFQVLKSEYPNAQLQESRDKFQKNALKIFEIKNKGIDEIKIHLKGTAFQLKVWEALLKIPPASLVSYNSIAKLISKPSSSRAVGNALGKNPIAYIIPCHRVIKSTGELGGYKWKETKKIALIGWEETENQILNEK